METKGGGERGDSRMTADGGGGGGQYPQDPLALASRQIHEAAPSHGLALQGLVVGKHADLAADSLSCQLVVSRDHNHLRGVRPVQPNLFQNWVWASRFSFQSLLCRGQESVNHYRSMHFSHL